MSIDGDREAPMNDLLRMPTVMQGTGFARPTLYRDMKRGLFPRPVKLGRASAWPSREVDAIVNARIAGKSEDEIRELVINLERQRSTAA